MNQCLGLGKAGVTMLGPLCLVLRFRAEMVHDVWAILMWAVWSVLVNPFLPIAGSDKFILDVDDDMVED